ncbi:uncharacterized protein [Dendropsophus ebraccatus]
MATRTKRQRTEEESTYRVWLRLCDPFIRTDGNLICPIIKAETSIRVLFRLREKEFGIVLHNVYKDTGIKTQSVTLVKPPPPDTNMQANLFIQCVSPNIINEDKLNQFKERLTFYLSKNTTVKCILVDRVNSTEETIPQPMISEPDFEMYKLELCCKTISKIQPESDEMDSVSFITDSIKKMIIEHKEKRTKIALLSQNGKGKSFLLNLLFLLTIDNQEEYQNNNKNLKLPKDVTGDPTIEEIGETLNQFPDVVKDVLKRHPNSKENFRALIESMYFKTKPPIIPDLAETKKLFLSLPKYFQEGGRIVAEPYILAQKNLKHSYESTTKCIIHLRYGTVYQIKVDYFSSEDLKQQLFELVSLSRSDKANVGNAEGLNKQIKDKAYECLKTRYALLTDTNIDKITENFLKRFNNYSDIELSEEVEQFAGRTELYIGSGKNATEDRLALKAILKAVTSPQNSDSERREWKHRVAAVQEIVVYIPSKFLYGGKEILEMPGTDDSDALALNFINEALTKADAVFVMSEFAFNNAEKDVKDILINSDFIQKWKKFPELFSLMFLAYPEKDIEFQIKNEDREKIGEIENLEIKKRSSELKELFKLLGMGSLPPNMDDTIFTSYILPVLHTSIHAQEGTPHQVIQEHASFLKCTGIDKVITHLDKFISSSRKMDFEQLQKTLTTNTTNTLLAENVRVLIQMYQNRELKQMREFSLFLEYDKLKNNLSKKLENVYTSKLEAQVAGTLEVMKKEALQIWDLNESNINSIGLFNPYYCGNHPTYKVRISEMILANIEKLTSEIFTFIKNEIVQLLKEFNKDAVNLFAEELNNVLICKISGYNNIDSRNFVKQSIRNVLSEAQQWYIGRQKKPINKHMVGKCLKESKKVILKKHILTPAYNRSDLDLAKQLARKNIAPAVMAFKTEIKSSLLILHDIRWKSFCSHLKSRLKGIPKPWQVLLSKLNQSCGSTNSQQRNPEDFSAVLKLITAKSPK